MSDLLPSLARAGKAGIDLSGARRASRGGGWAFLLRASKRGRTEPALRGFAPDASTKKAQRLW